MSLGDRIKSVFRWLLGMFGYQDNSTWGMTIKRIWGTCLAICALTFTAQYVYHAITAKPQEVDYYEWPPTRLNEDAARDEWESEMKRERENPEGIVSFEDDNGKCGYKREGTGEIIIPAQYDFAWDFSEGVGAVEVDSTIFFVRRDGSKAFEQEFRPKQQFAVMKFSNGYCAMFSDKEPFYGMIDHQGNWALMPVFELAYASEEGFYAILPNDDNVLKLYDFDGKTVLNELVINEVSELSYNNADNEKSLATLLRYCCRKFGPYGLITTDGKVITKPIYKGIEAISKDLYLCKPEGCLIDSSGNKVSLP